MKNKLSKTEKPCTIHGISGCSICLKRCIEEILYMTYAAGNGGYVANFGPVLFSRMVKLTGYDLSKRRILDNGHQ